MFRKALNLFFGVLLAIASGTVMTYPMYSYYIKTKFDFSLRQLNLYATFINIGVWVAFGMGLIYDSVGTRISNIIALILLPGGFLILYKLIQSSSVSLFWFLLIALIMGQGSSLAYINALSTSVKNFSKINSSNVIGLIISNSAIAPSIFTSVKTFFDSMSIKTFIIFIIFYCVIVIVLCIFWFDVYQGKKREEFDDKLFYEFKQRFIVFLFLYANFLCFIIFIGFLLFNHIFGVELPAFILFILLHIAFVVFVILEWKGKFETWIKNRFNRTHSRDIPIVNNFEIIGRRVDVIANNKKIEEEKKIVDKEINKDKKGGKKDINNNDKNKDDNKIYSESENMSKIKDKYNFGFSMNKVNDEDKDENNKNEKSLNVNINKRILSKNLSQNQNINNIAENNKKSIGRVSLESNSNKEEENNKEKDKNDKEKDEDEKGEEEKDEEKKEENKKEKGEKEKKDNNNEGNIDNINNDKDEKNENSSLEKSIKNLNKFHIKEDNKDVDNNENIDNEAKNKKEIENSKIEVKSEKIDDSSVNYPKFSITSDKSLEENPYIEKGKEDEKEKPKFSIVKEQKDIKNNNTNINNKDNEPKIKKEINEKKQEKNLDLEQNQIKNKNQKQATIPSNIKNIPNHETKDYNSLVQNTNTYFLNNNNNNNIPTNTNSSFMPLNTTSSSLFDLDKEDEDDDSENYTRCVFFFSLFRRRQIILLFIVLALTMGSMISNVNNIKFIIFSIDSDNDISSTSLDKYPLLYFAFNSLSRIVMGRICNQLMGTDETFAILAAITSVGLISQIFGFFMVKFFVYLSISFAGMTHGGLMTFAPLYCRYYFHIKNLGTVLGFLTTGNAVGSIIISTLIFPIFYHKYSIKDKNGEEICNKKKCSSFSYAINCLFVIAACGLSHYLYVEDKKKKIKKRREKEHIYRNSDLSNFQV